MKKLVLLLGLVVMSGCLSKEISDTPVVDIAEIENAKVVLPSEELVDLEGESSVLDSTLEEIEPSEEAAVLVEPGDQIEGASVQDSSWTACDGLFPYTGNQGNSTFVDTTAGALNHVNGAPDTVHNGYEIRGCVRQMAGSYGSWGPFEGNLGSYQIKDSTGTVLASGPLGALVITAQPEVMAAAMAGDNLAFRETLIFDFTPYAGQNGTLELQNENASGEVVNDRVMSYPIVF